MVDCVVVESGLGDVVAMRLPAIQGVIRRRVLVNFRVDPEVIERQLPPPFRPKLLRGSAVAGICLIRLERMRPRFLPVPFGQSSENAAHRIAVRWTDAFGEPREGVYVPRRDTSSAFNHLAGGRLFPGIQHRAQFEVQDEGGRIDLSVQSRDGQVTVRVRAHEVAELPAGSRFTSLAEASSFFERGCLGYSATHVNGRLDGMRLVPTCWHVVPLAVEEWASSYFSDPTRFPSGSVTFDCALLMRNIEHLWQSVPSLETRSAEAQAAAQAGLVGTA
jgi:hypothetical protein